MVGYAVAIPLAFASRWVSLAVYAAIALWWLVPDRRLQKLALEESFRHWLLENNHTTF